VSRRAARGTAGGWHRGGTVTGRASGASSSTRPGIAPGRSFDPRRVGQLECAAWVTYYRRAWWAFLRSAVLLVRHTFGLPWPATLVGAWLVLRANQHWAPYPDNRPDGARRCMRRFYALVARHNGEPFDVDEAARLEVEWWRVHREAQHGAPRPSADGDRPEPVDAPLVQAIARLYSHVYGVPAVAVAPAAAERALAMRLSDEWVAAGCELASPLLPRVRAALVRSYAALLAAVHRVTVL
jgi:hypothetical protein